MNNFERRVYHTYVSTDLVAKALADKNVQKALDVVGELTVSYGFGSDPTIKTVLVLKLPDGVDPKTVVDMNWEEIIPNEEKSETVGREPNTTDTVG